VDVHIYTNQFPVAPCNAPVPSTLVLASLRPLPPTEAAAELAVLSIRFRQRYLHLLGTAAVLWSAGRSPLPHDFNLWDKESRVNDFEAK